MGVKKSISRTWYIFLAALTSAAIAQAAVPTTITYQGRILNNTGTPVTTTKFITLTLKDLNSGSSDIVFAQNVTPSSQGEFSVSFSIPGSFKWDTATARLEVKVDSDVLTPNDQFGVTPYSIVATSVTANGITTNALANGAVTDVKVSTISASKIILSGGSTPISTWQLGAGNFIDASKVALPGSTATVASWQYGATGFIDVAKVTGTIPTTPVAHATSHGLVGTDPLNGLSPLQISGTAVVLRSTSSQTIQPQVGSDVVPLVIKPNASVPAGSINALEVFTNASTTSVTIRGDGLMTVKGTLNANGPVNATNGLTVTGSLNVSTIVPSGNLNISGRVRDNYGYLVPPGTIVAFAGTTAPSGWLLCDGATKDKSIQPELSELKLVLGSTYGPETTNTFVLPNLKGRVPMGSGIGAGSTNWTIGTSTGSETQTLSQAQMPIHNHGNVVKTWNQQYDTIGGYGNQFVGTNYLTASDSAGGGLPHPIIQPSLVLNYIIKY